jgi:hypothetical protein
MFFQIWSAPNDPALLRSVSKGVFVKLWPAQGVIYLTVFSPFTYRAIQAYSASVNCAKTFSLSNLHK